MESNRLFKIIGALLLGLVLVGGAVFAYIWVSGGSGEASQEISAPTLAVNTAVAEVETETDETTNATEEVTETGNGGITTFDIVGAESTVSFEIYEELNGAPTDVIGKTQEVAGQIAVDFDNPQASQIGTIRINMRTLATDNEFRNRAIRGQILQTSRDEFEFSDFVPTEITGLPESVTVGEAFTFTVVGDLTVVGVAKPVTFNVTVTPETETRLVGTATAEVAYADWGINTPTAPAVANVADTVTLTLDFVAQSAN